MTRSPNRGIAMLGAAAALLTIGVYACQSGNSSGVGAGSMVVWAICGAVRRGRSSRANSVSTTTP